MRSRRVLSVASLVLILAAATSPTVAQTIAVQSAAAAVVAPGPFFRGELVQFDLSGFQPNLPLTILMGVCGGASCGPFSAAVPGVAGTMGVDPATIVPFLPWDGIGFFGSPQTTVRANSAGNLNFVLQLSPTFITSLPANFRFQVISLQTPTVANGGLSFRFSNVVDMAVAEPTDVPPITAISPAAFIEGAPITITLTGGLIQRSNVVPTVRFDSTCAPGQFAFGTNVQIIDTDPGPGISPALQCTTPAFIGAATVPPATSAGRIVVTVDYSASPLFPNNPGNAVRATTAANETDPGFFAMQSPLVPNIASIVVKASATTGGTTVTISGQNFMNCSRIDFDAGGPGQVQALAVPVLNANSITVFAPPHAAGLVTVRVRNPDHLTASPRETLANAASSFAYFAFNPNQISVTDVTPHSVTESGTPFVAHIIGTCPFVGPPGQEISLLTPACGAPAVRIGSAIMGTVADLATSAGPVTITGPGQFDITATFPGFPPGLNAFGPSGASGPGLTNTGRKSVQVFPPVQFGFLPHLDYGAIPGAEPQNFINYLGPVPRVFDITPNNVGRVGGGQSILIHGQNFFTQATSLAAATAGTTSLTVLTTAIPETPCVFAQIINQSTLRVITPDLSAIAPFTPLVVQALVRNPDGQDSTFNLPANDDIPDGAFVVDASIASGPTNTFSLAGPSVTVDTTPGGTAQVWTFAGNTTIPASLLVNAEGSAPLIVRCTGNLTVDGSIDLSGGTITSGPYGHPAGGGAGGAGATAITLGAQSATAGASGAAPIDPATGLPWSSTFGLGGEHDTLAGGGGGGAFFDVGLPGVAGATVYGGVGGLSFNFANGTLPLPPLGGPAPFDTLLPPGGAGGAAGGLGTVLPFVPGTPPPAADVGFGGTGGNGGGGLLLACDGVLTITGSLSVSGQAGAAGQISGTTMYAGGGGGGGAGGGIVMMALQGIQIGPAAVITSTGGAGGSAASTSDGGSGAAGLIRLAIPASSRHPNAVISIAGTATLNPAPQTRSF